MTEALLEFQKKKILILGDEKIGQSACDFIGKYVDLGSIKYIPFPFSQENLDEIINIDFTEYVIIKSPEVPGRMVPAPYTTPTKIFFSCAKHVGSKIIGITGTKGKTTVASLLHHTLKEANFNSVLDGVRGYLTLSNLAEANGNTYFILELSSYQLSELEQCPDIAIITNLYRDHIDYHQTLENYWEAKRNIMRAMNESGKVIYNPLTDIVSHWLAESAAERLPIDPNEVVDMKISQLIGDHNRLNYLLVRSAAQVLGIDRFTYQTALKSFEPVKHRLQKVRTVRGITFIDDAIASQPEEAITGITACLREVGPVGCVMLGGKDKDYDFTELVKLLSTLLIPKLVLFPDTGEKIKALLPENYTPELCETDDMKTAVDWAVEHLPSGSICLLSSASPSNSLWKDFEEKGDIFQKAVQALSN